MSLKNAQCKKCLKKFFEKDIYTIQQFQYRTEPPYKWSIEYFKKLGIGEWDSFCEQCLLQYSKESFDSWKEWHYTPKVCGLFPHFGHFDSFDLKPHFMHCSFTPIISWDGVFTAFTIKITAIKTPTAIPIQSNTIQYHFVITCKKRC